MIAEGIEDMETLEYLRGLDRSELSDSSLIQAGRGTSSGGRRRSCRRSRLDAVEPAA